MILRWIVERSSSGSARPLGGPGPPIAGFVMVCPWRPRYLPRYTVPLSFCWLHNGTSESFHYAALYCVVYLYSHMMFLYIFFLFLFQGRVEILNGEVTIHKVQQADSGMYQCVAENKYGAIYSNAELKILGNFIWNEKDVQNTPLRKKRGSEKCTLKYLCILITCKVSISFPSQCKRCT